MLDGAEALAWPRRLLKAVGYCAAWYVFLLRMAVPAKVVEVGPRPFVALAGLLGGSGFAGRLVLTRTAALAP